MGYYKILDGRRNSARNLEYFSMTAITVYENWQISMLLQSGEMKTDLKAIWHADWFKDYTSINISMKRTHYFLSRWHLHSIKIFIARFVIIWFVKRQARPRQYSYKYFLWLAQLHITLAMNLPSSGCHPLYSGYSGIGLHLCTVLHLNDAEFAFMISFSINDQQSGKKLVFQLFMLWRGWFSTWGLYYFNKSA